MKLILALFCVLNISQAFTMEIKVDDWKRDRDMDRSIELITQSVGEKVTLDCQSFFQGLWFGEYEEAKVVTMGADQCMGLMDRIKKSVRAGSSHCVVVSDEVNKDYRCR